jgi:hypothetical protein
MRPAGRIQVKASRVAICNISAANVIKMVSGRRRLASNGFGRRLLSDFLGLAN